MRFYRLIRPDRVGADGGLLGDTLSIHALSPRIGIGREQD
jgi:hypothetical protein